MHAFFYFFGIFWALKFREFFFFYWIYYTVVLYLIVDNEKEKAMSRENYASNSQTFVEYCVPLKKSKDLVLKKAAIIIGAIFFFIDLVFLAIRQHRARIHDHLGRIWNGYNLRKKAQKKRFHDKDIRNGACRSRKRGIYLQDRRRFYWKAIFLCIKLLFKRPLFR